MKALAPRRRGPPPARGRAAPAARGRAPPSSGGRGRAAATSKTSTRWARPNVDSAGHDATTRT